jgi:hypothetical protein
MRRSGEYRRCNTLTLPSHIERTADAFATPLQHMGIDHGGADILVPQQFLHGANVITCFEQMSHKAMAQRVTTALFGNARSRDRILHRSLQHYL